MAFKKLGLTVVLAAFFGVQAPLAHHSHGNYLMNEYAHLEGTIKEVHWLNPHSWIYLEVDNEDGEPVVWALEGASVGQLMNRGWTREDLNPGDPISVRCHQLRDGSPGCLLGFLTTEGGEERIFD